MACGEPIESDLARRVRELERIVMQMGPPYLETRHQPCLFDGVNPDTNPVMGLACPCPRCSPR